MMRLKFVEILKFIVAVAIGFTLRVMFENSYHSISHHLPCDITKDSISDLNLGNIHDQLRQPHQPSSILDVIEYRYFNSTVVFDTHLGYVKTKMKQYHRSDIRDIIRQVESLMNAGANNRYKMKNVINGFERIDPVRGKEYVIDLELIPEFPTSTKSKPLIFRYSLVKPFSYAQMVSRLEVSPTKSMMIDMLYIISGDDVNFIHSILIHHEAHIINLFPVNVTMYVCSKTSLSPNIRQELNAFVLKFNVVSSYILNFVVNDSCNFEAPKIADIAVKSLGDRNSRIVILNCNIYVTHQFLQRCSSVLNENSNIYSPIPFATFLHQSARQTDELGEESGVWDHDNFEVMCIRKNDFIEGGGLQNDKYYSGAFFSILNRLIGTKKQVFRSTDPSVKVFYHNHKCNDQELFKYSNVSFCKERQRRTFKSHRDILKSIKLD